MLSRVIVLAAAGGLCRLRLIVSLGVGLALSSPLSATAEQPPSAHDHAAPGGLRAEQLGKVSFPTSCDPRVQAQFERGVALLHSYWFTEARKAFDGVVQQDPHCAIG